MPFDFLLYQIKAEPPPSTQPAIALFESAWHQAWSEPVRFKVDPRLRITLIVSGPFAPVLEPNTEIIQTFESRWHQPWSEPVRLPKRLRTGMQQFQSTFFDILPKSSNQIQGWLLPMAEPVRQKKGLRAYLQQFFAYHPRYLPPPNVTVRIVARETNSDHAEFDVNTVEEQPLIDKTGVNVSITEIAAGSDGGVSFREQEPT